MAIADPWAILSTSRVPTGWNKLPPRPSPLAVNRELVQSVADLHSPQTGAERWVASLRVALLALGLTFGAALYWLLPPSVSGLAALVLAGVAYALLLIASHEMVHGTLLGWPSLEFGLGCLLGWPMAWPFATYSRLHLLHHRWNGVDGRDPERTQTLSTDPPPIGPLGRWLRCHPFPGRCLCWSG